jgi:hypothetical protein
MNKKMRSMKRGLSKRGIKTRKVKGLKGRKVNSFKSGKNINLVGGVVTERETFSIDVKIQTKPVLVNGKFKGKPETHKFLISYVPENDGIDPESYYDRAVDTFSITLDTSGYGGDAQKEQRGNNIPMEKVLDTMYAVLDNSHSGPDQIMAGHAVSLEDHRDALYKKMSALNLYKGPN